jgi:hypothetical protein
MSRSTRVYREVVDEGARHEQTIWSAGHVQVYRDGQDQRRDHGKANLTFVYWKTPEKGVEIGPLLASEAILASDVLRAAAVSAGGSACGGQTLLELMWAELMTIMERLMTGQDAEDDRGMAQGMAYAIAIMQNPYRPNVDDVRTQAMAKWEEDQA